MYRKRPRTWATDRGFPAVPTKGGREQWGRQAPRVSNKVVREGAQTVGSDNSRNFCINGTARVRDSSFLQIADLETWSEWTVGTKITFFGASGAHGQADATSEMAIELPPEEQAKGRDFVGELLNSLHGARKAAHSWERKWQSGIVEMNFEIGTRSPAIVCCCEREVCGFVQEAESALTLGGSKLSLNCLFVGRNIN